MDGNKDEALRCKLIAKEAIATGNKQRARKFVKMAQRLNSSLYVDDLLASCEKLETNSPASSLDEGTPDVDISEPAPAKAHANFIGERNNTDEHVQLIREIKKSKDYYSILGVGRSCSVEEIKRAYRKLLLKVHPDKNRALGSEDAFKKVSNAFKCLSNEDLRRQYDQVGQVEEFEYNQQHNIRQRQQRRRTAYDTYDNDFDLDEIFRASFGHNDMFRSFRMSQAYRSRSASARQRENSHGGGSNFILLLQLLPFLIIFVLAYLPYTEPDYSLQKGYSYQFLKKTEKHGVDFFVKSLEFDRNHPVGSPARTSIEDRVIKDYKNLLGRYCHIELQRRHWGRNLPTPHCDRLQNIGVA